MNNTDVKLFVYEDLGSAIKVEGIENWIESLLPIEEVKYDGDPVIALKMVDPKTNALFLIKRLK